MRTENSRKYGIFSDTSPRCSGTKWVLRSNLELPRVGYLGGRVKENHTPQEQTFIRAMPNVIYLTVTGSSVAYSPLIAAIAIGIAGGQYPSLPMADCHFLLVCTKRYVYVGPFTRSKTDHIQMFRAIPSTPKMLFGDSSPQSASYFRGYRLFGTLLRAWVH